MKVCPEHERSNALGIGAADLVAAWSLAGPAAAAAVSALTALSSFSDSIEDDSRRTEIFGFKQQKAFVSALSLAMQVSNATDDDAAKLLSAIRELLVALDDALAMRMPCALPPDVEAARAAASAALALALDGARGRVLN